MNRAEPGLSSTAGEPGPATVPLLSGAGAAAAFFGSLFVFDADAAEAAPFTSAGVFFAAEAAPDAAFDFAPPDFFSVVFAMERAA